MSVLQRYKVVWFSLECFSLTSLRLFCKSFFNSSWHCYLKALSHHVQSQASRPKFESQTACSRRHFAQILRGMLTLSFLKKWHLLANQERLWGNLKEGTLVLVGCDMKFGVVRAKEVLGSRSGWIENKQKLRSLGEKHCFDPYLMLFIQVLALILWFSLVFPVSCFFGLCCRMFGPLVCRSSASNRWC